MLVFNNQQQSGFEEIASYGPKFYLDIKEMEAIYKFAGYTLDLMAADLEKLVACQFIANMNEESISRMEKFLGIASNSNRTLEERITIVQAAWNSSGKMSKSKIIAIVNSFVECDCDVSLTDSQIEIFMTFKDDPAKYMGNIRELINKGIPAHLGIVYNGLIDTKIEFVWKNRVSIPILTIQTNFNIRELFYTSAKNIIEFSISEKVSSTLTIKNDLWYLDGEYYLDGSKLLDSYIKEEEL